MDKKDFYQNTGYEVLFGNSGVELIVGSNVKHEQYVLGGKEPSWTPIAPLISWVERKDLKWTDKKTGFQLKVEQIAYMIRAKIKREGIEGRNVFAEVIKNKQEWIYKQLDSIEIAL